MRNLQAPSRSPAMFPALQQVLLGPNGKPLLGRQQAAFPLAGNRETVLHRLLAVLTAEQMVELAGVPAA